MAGMPASPGTLTKAGQQKRAKSRADGRATRVGGRTAETHLTTEWDQRHFKTMTIMWVRQVAKEVPITLRLKPGAVE